MNIRSHTHKHMQNHLLRWHLGKTSLEYELLNNRLSDSSLITVSPNKRPFLYSSDNLQRWYHSTCHSETIGDYVNTYICSDLQGQKSYAVFWGVKQVRCLRSKTHIGLWQKGQGFGIFHTKASCTAVPLHITRMACINRTATKISAPETFSFLA